MIHDKQMNLSQIIIYAGAIFIGSAIAEFFLFWLSVQYEVYEGVVSWYFPAGFRFFLLLFLPIRYWGSVWVGGSVGLLLYHTNYVLPNAIVGEHFTYHFYALLALPIIYYVQSRYLQARYSLSSYVSQELMTVQKVLVVLGAFIATRLVDTLINLALTGPLYAGTPEHLLAEVFIAHQLAALLPFLFMFTCVYLALWLRTRAKTAKQPQLYKLFILNILIGIVLLTLHVTHPGLNHLLVVLVFIGIVWLGTRHGFAALISFTITINGLLLLYLFDRNDGELLLSYMPFMTSYCLVALFVGGYLLETDRVKRNLNISNDTLARNNTKLRCNPPLNHSSHK